MAEHNSTVNLRIDFTPLPDSGDVTAQDIAKRVEAILGVQLDMPVSARVISAFVVRPEVVKVHVPSKANDYTNDPALCDGCTG